MKGIVFVVLLVLLIGCQEPEQNKNTYTIQGEAPAGSSVQIKNTDGEVLAKATADGEGIFEVNVDPYEPQLFYVEAISGVTPMLDGVSVVHSGSESFKAILPYAPKVENYVAVNGLTTLAAAVANYHMSESQLGDNEAYKRGYDLISDWLGADIRFTPETEADSRERLTLLNTAVHNWCQRQKQWYGPIANSCTMSNVYRLAAKDLEYDGLNDGIVLSGQLELAGQKFGGGVFKKEVPIEILRIVEDREYDSDRNLGNSFAERMMTHSGEVVVYDQDFSVEKNVPFIELGNVGVTAKNEHVITYNVFDYKGVKYLKAVVGGVEIELEPMPGQLEIDTTNYLNGVLPISFEATSSVGVVSSLNTEITIANKYETISKISAGDKIVESAAVDLEAQVSRDQGIKEVRFTIDSTVVRTFASMGATTSPVDLKYEYDTSLLADGDHTFLVEVETALGNTYSKSLQFKTKNVGPEIYWPLPVKNEDETPDVPVYTGIETISFTVKDDFPVELIEIYWGDSQTPLRQFAAGGAPGEEEYLYELSLTVDVRTLYEARHKIHIRAKGASGVSSVESREVMVDWSPPSIKVLAINGTVLRGPGPHTIEYQIVETNAVDVDSMMVDIIHPDDENWSDTLINSYDPSLRRGEIVFYPPAYDDGVRQLKLNVNDISGKSSKAVLKLIYGHYPPYIVSHRMVITSESGDVDSGYHEVFVKDPYASRDPTVSDFSVNPIITADSYIREVAYVSPMSPDGIFSFRTNNYDPDTSGCDSINKRTETDTIESLVDYTSPDKLTLSMKLSSRVSDNLSSGVVRVEPDHDCKTKVSW